MHDRPDPSAPLPGAATSGNPLYQVPVEVTVAIGRARPRIGDLMEMAAGAVLVLDRRIDDPVELWVGERLIARGALEETDEPGGLCVRLTDIADLQSGF